MKIQIKNTELKGLGVFANENITANSVITDIRYVREVTKETPLAEHEKHLYEHQIYLPDGRIFIVDEPECFFNHSCSPNAFLYSANEKYFIIAKNNINKDEEITIDYELSAINGDVWECKCGSLDCRGLHKWDFFSLPDQTILEALPFLDPWFAQVHGKEIQLILERNLKKAQ